MLGEKVIDHVDRYYRNVKLYDPITKSEWDTHVKPRVLLNYDYTVVWSFSTERGISQSLKNIDEQTAKALMSDIC